VSSRADLLDSSDAGPAAVRGGALRTGGYVVAVALSAASAPLLVRHLGVIDFGRYVTVLSVITIVGGITDAGLTAIGVREYSVRERSARDRLLRNLLGTRIVLTLVGIVLATGFSAVSGYGEALVVGTFLAGIGLLVQVVQNTLTVPLQTGLRFGAVTAGELLRQVVAVLFIVGLVIAGAGVVPFLATPIPAALAALALTAWLIRGVPLRPAFELEEWRPLLRDTLPFAAATVLSVVYFRMAIVLMSLLATDLETGYFATSYRVLEVLIGVPALLVGAAFPILARAARDDQARLRYALGRLTEVALIGGTLMALCLVLGAGFFMDVIGGDQADPSVPVLRIQGPALIATFLAATYQFGLLSLRNHKALLGVNAAALVTSVGLTVALVGPYGAQGAAVATLAAEVVLAAGSLAFLSRTAVGTVLPGPTVGKVAVAAALACSVLLAPLPEVARAALGAALYLATLLVLRAFPAELLDVLPPRLRGRR
jgi:O-antigen/teichoic acid export membrane protein